MRARARALVGLCVRCLHGRVCSPTGVFSPLVIPPKQLNHVGHIGGGPHRDGDPARFGEDVVRPGPPRGDQFVADPSREGQVGKGGVQVPELAAPNPELDSAYARIWSRMPPYTKVRTISLL